MRGKQRILFVLFFLALFPAVVAAESVSEVSAAGKGTSKTKPKEDLPNFHEVHPYLYRGGEPNEAGMHKLKSMGVKTLIDLRAPSERKMAEDEKARELGLTYINLPMTSAPPTDKQVAAVLDAIKKAKADPAQGSVFVHCAHGSDRTGCLIGIWRVTQEGWTYDDAYTEMRKYYFTPKFTRLSGAVRDYATEKKQ